MAKVAVADVAGIDARLAAAFEVLAESPDGVARMRELVLSLAVRGLLVEQRPCDEPASSLLRKIAQEKARLVGLGKLKRSALRGDESQSTGPYAIPSNWAWSSLAVVFAKITDGTHHSPPNGATGDFPYVSARHIKSEGVRRDDLTWVSKQVHDEIWSRCDPEDGDILYIKDGATTGVVTVCDFGQPFSMLSSVGLLKAHRFIEPWYACYALRSPFFLSQMREQMSGVGIPRVTIGKLEGAVLPIPPLAEQRRIVARVDELMTWIDQFEAARNQREAARIAARDACLATLCAATNPTEVAAAWSTIGARFESLFAAPADVGPLRQSVLRLAVRGLLVPQDASDEPATRFLDDVRELRDICNVRAPRGSSPSSHGEMRPLQELPPGWKWAPFGETHINRDGERVPVASEVRQTRRGSFDYYGASGVIDKIDDYLFDEPLLLVGEDGANLTLRSTPVAYMAEGRYWVNNHAHVLDSPDKTSLRYLAVFLNGLDLRPYLTGTAQPKLNQAKMNGIPCPVPPLAEQKRIVARVDELMAVCDQLGAALVSARSGAEAVAASLLASEVVE